MGSCQAWAVNGYPLPMCPPTPPHDPAAYRAARAAAHSIAEWVLAPDLHRSTGRIGLRATPGGIGQPEHLRDGARRLVRLDGWRLAVVDGDAETWHAPSTLGAAAQVVDLELGEGTGAYEPSTPSTPDTSVEMDPAAAAHLAEVFAFIEACVEAWRSERSELTPTFAQLWPEHFDLGCSAVEINFGGSPGDEGRPEPYLYVGPWTPRVGSFWNEPYGAACSLYELESVADGVAFFERGLAEATRR